MSLKYALLAAFLFLIPLGSARADQSSDIAACRSFTAEGARLACYDGISISAPAKASSGDAISWADLNVDYKQLRGKTVTTSGFFLMMGDQGLLYDQGGGMVAFFLDIEKLPRAQRSALYENCTSGCEVAVTGKVSDIMMQRGIKAQSITVQ